MWRQKEGGQAVKQVEFRKFTPSEHQTWRQLFERQAVKRDEQIYDLFSEGLAVLGITADQIPDLEVINAIFCSKTGFKGIPVEGLENGTSFFPMLTRREFPIGNFIREPHDLSYTPAPDVFHDLYGHLPFFIDNDYADFCEELGRRACRYIENPPVLRQFERLFWFTIEFALVKTQKGKRIFGAGIASSFGECRYALSDEPEVLPFDLEVIRHQEFKIDEFQKRLFILESPKQLYECLDEFETKLSEPSRKAEVS